jgi:hypothetical protein
MKHVSNDDLTGKSFKIITHNGKDGMLQSNLWKELDITSRDGSRLAVRLEKQSLIKREKILEKGRWTYKLLPIELHADIVSIDKAPCLMCPVEHMCSEDGSYSPNNCNLIQDWLLLSTVDSLSQRQYHTAPKQKKNPDLSAKQPKLSAKRILRPASKNNKKIIKNETFSG